MGRQNKQQQQTTDYNGRPGNAHTPEAGKTRDKRAEPETGPNQGITKEHSRERGPNKKTEPSAKRHTKRGQTKDRGK